MLVSMKKILEYAEERGIAIPAFNTYNLEVSKAIIEEAEELHSPVIIAVSESAMKYAGIHSISALLVNMADRVNIPVAIHLDHGKSVDSVLLAIRYGWTSVMIDGSHLPYDENVSLTKKVVEIAHPLGITVEGELGRLVGVEDELVVEDREAFMTDPDEALRFVEETGVDALAVAIGTSHGAYKFKGEPKLDLERLERIKERVKVPLVLHGASKVPPHLVELANKFGAKIEGARGVPDDILFEAVKRGIRKVNTDTDLRIAFTAGVRKYLFEHPEDFNPRNYLNAGTKLLREVVRDRIKVLRGEIRE